MTGKVNFIYFIILNMFFLTFYVFEQSLWGQQGEADCFQHLNNVLFPFCHILKDPVHGCSENLVLILNPQLLTPQNLHQLVL